MSDNKKQIRWGILGCGDVTEVKSGPAYQKTEGFTISAVMRRNLEKAKDYAKRHYVEKYYMDADQLINDNNVDAVYIATPPDVHMFYALKVAEAGKICCIEKPLAPSYQESMTIFTAFTEKDLPFFVAYYRRCLPRFTQIKTWLTENHIGTIRHIHWALHKPPSIKDLSGANNWRTDSKVAPGGYFDDLASHGLDLFTFLLGNIKEVHGISLNQQQLYGAKDAFTACWMHDNNITGSGSWNFGSNYLQDKVTISGSKGEIVFSIFEENPIILKSDNIQKEIFIEHPKHVQLPFAEAMRDQLISGNRLHPSTGATATHTSWVMDQIVGRS